MKLFHVYYFFLEKLLQNIKIKYIFIFEKLIYEKYINFFYEAAQYNIFYLLF